MAWMEFGVRLPLGVGLWPIAGWSRTSWDTSACGSMTTGRWCGAAGRRKLGSGSRRPTTCVWSIWAPARSPMTQQVTTRSPASCRSTPSVLAAHPDVDCVVHAHPPDVVVASLAGFALEPIFGAYDIPAARLAAAGISVHPRSVLIRTGELAAEMVASLGDAAAVVLKGHGIVTTGTDVADGRAAGAADRHAGPNALARACCGGDS